MRLPRFVGTSSFRLTLLYAALFCLSYLILFAVIYVSAAGYMKRQIDTSVSGEIDEIEADVPGGDPARLAAAIDMLTNRSPEFFYLVEDADGRKLAGNLPPIPPVAGVLEMRRRVTGKADQAKYIRGQGVTLTGGTYLFVALSNRQLHEMRELIERAFFWGFGVTLLLALSGGALMSLSVLSRVEALGMVSREIVAGDLRRRIPLRGSHDEFDRLAASVNAMLDRIQELMEDVRQVSTDIAHDLRTPLTRLRQRVELASRKATDVESLRLALDRTLRDVDGVLDTFGALLKIARIEASPPAGFAAVDLTEILATIVEVYAPAAEENRQDLTERIAPGLTVRGDRELLMQLFANLLENATRHAGAGTRIEVLATRSGDRIEVTVADRGPGIPEAMRRRVFQRFFRLESSRTTPGNGLGLSLARAIAAFHQTSVELADNQPGLRASVSLCAAAP